MATKRRPVKKKRTSATRGKNQTFPYSAATRDRILKTFKVGQHVRASLKRRGQDAVVGGIVTRVARTGWLYVKLAGRRSPMKADPTKWAPGAATAGAKKPAAKPAKKSAVKKPPRRAAPAPKRRAIAGGSEGAAPAAATKAKRARVRKKKAPPPVAPPASADSVAAHMEQGGGVAPEQEEARPVRTPVRAEEHTEELA